MAQYKNLNSGAVVELDDAAISFLTENGNIKHFSLIEVKPSELLEKAVKKNKTKAQENKTESKDLLKNKY